MMFITGSAVIALLISKVYSASDPILRKIEAVETDVPPKIDGKLDEPCWQKAAQTGDFIQFEPLSGQPASQKTKIYLLYDQNRLYVGFECFKNDMNTLAANETQRDGFFFSDDHVEVFLDTYWDKRNCYGFALNPLGTQVDRRIINEGANVRQRRSDGASDRAWDCDWDGRAAKYDDRWTAEFSIPFAELRFPTKKQNPHAVWGINFWRNDESRQEEQSWIDLGDRQYAVSRFGHLIGLPVDRLVTTRPLEIKPYGTIKPQKVSKQDAEMKADTGIDLRYPFSSVTMDVTVNPDFAQIEADPNQVNLTDIPLRFPEKRPFFLEGNELFQTPIELFYSRRVEDLMYGGKMVGKVGDYNLAMVTAQARVEERPEDEEVEENSLPLGEYNYSVFRVQRDLGQTSSIGFLGVSKQRGGLYDRAAGIDARFTLPADVNLSLEYAREWKPDSVWKSDIDSDIDNDAIFAELSRRTNTFSFEARAGDIGEHFNVETGFIPRTDRRGFELSSRYSKQYTGLIQRLRGEARYEWLENHAGRRMNERRRVEGMIGIMDFFFFSGPEWYYHVDDFTGQPYTDKVLGFFVGWFPPKWASIRNFGSVGIRDDKDSFFISPEISLRPTSKLSIEMNLQRLVEDGELTQWTRRLTVNYQFAQRMYVRSSAEFTIEKEQRIFGLFAWEYRPESTFFIVYNDNRDAARETERVLFVKLAHLLKVGMF